MKTPLSIHSFLLNESPFQTKCLALTPHYLSGQYPAFFKEPELMCGIAGIIGRLDEPNRAALKRMNDPMIHRGPDAGGTWVSARAARGGGALLAPRRLSTLALSPAG